MIINNNELEKFASISDDWWDVNGDMKMLHLINTIRIEFILRQVYKNFICAYEDISILDFGCGVGILTENLKRLKFNVLGVDGNENLISIAQRNAEKSGLNVDFQTLKVEELQNFDKNFSIVIASEVLEHLNEQQIKNFFSFCQRNLLDNGILIISTINKTISSLLFAKFAAEYILKWVPKKTHDWKNFLKPSYLNKIAKKYQLKSIDLQGMNFDPIKREWKLSNSTRMNYLMCWKKIATHT